MFDGIEFILMPTDERSASFGPLKILSKGNFVLILTGLVSKI